MEIRQLWKDSDMNMTFVTSVAFERDEEPILAWMACTYDLARDVWNALGTSHPLVLVQSAGADHNPPSHVE